MPSRAPRILAGCFPYVGGKRRLVRAIFAVLDSLHPRAAWPDSPFVDPMCGAGAVALAAKAYGFDVTAADRARRGVIPARALVAKATVRLKPVHLRRLARPVPSDGPARAFVPRVFDPAEAAWIDSALAVAAAYDEPLRSLVLQLVVTAVLRLKPMSSLTATDAGAAAAEDWDRISPGRLGHYLRSAETLRTPALRRIADRINGSVFAGRGRAAQADARQTLASVDAGVAYLDPPYPGTLRYESEFAVLDTLLGDDAPPRGDPPSIDALLDAAHRIPLVVISYGGRRVTLDGLVEQVRVHRPVLRVEAIRYPHLHALASPRHRAANREFLVVAGGAP